MIEPTDSQATHQDLNPQTPKQRIKISKLCARLVQHQCGSLEAMSAFLQKKVIDTGIVHAAQALIQER